MGNKIARTTQVSATEYYLHDLPSSYNLVLIEVLGRGRFFKSILCKHDEGLVLVKVYFKRGERLDLKEYEKRLFEIRNIFQTVQHPHVWPFQFWLETDKAAYLLRQHFFSNLHDRLSTRPFLSLIEKKWLAYQLLCAVKQSHDKEVCHGDIKCENVLVTSWNWLYLADFASFKPTYIPDDDPSDFSFFFDTGGRRRCYLAPERFYDHVGEAHSAPDAPLKKSMDIFSVGCVIAELFLEGQPLFELSQLLAYRRGQYDPSLYLEKIPDVGIREMILHMIQLNPEERLSCDSYLQSYASAVFPSYFSPFLHQLFSCLIPLDSDTRVAMTKGAFSEISRQMMNDRAVDAIVSETSDANLIDNESFQKFKSGKENANSPYDGADPSESIVGKGLQLVDDLDSIYREVEKNNAFSHTKAKIGNTANVSTYSSSTKSTIFSNQTKRFGRQSSFHAHGKENEITLFKKFHKNDLESLMAGYNIQSESNEMPFFQFMEFNTSCEGMVLIASLLCSCIRSVKQPQLRRAGVLMLRSCSFYIDDEDRLQHVLPYVIAMLSDPAAIVRCAALDTLCDVLALVRDFPPSDAKIFSEYILPMLSMLPDDPEESVRICYARNIFKIALAAYRFLICSKNLADTGSYDKVVPTKSQLLSTEPSVKKDAENSDAQLAQLRKSIAEVVQELVMGSKQTPSIRRALLQDIGHLCFFFEQKQCNDFLLPILPAFLNDRDEQLRAVFYGQIVFVCYFVGQRSVEEYLLPYIDQALTDGMEAVIVNALDCLSMLCRSGFLRKRILLDMIERSFPLLCYPSQWVRRSVATFIAASSQTLGPVDSYVYLYPILRPFLQREPPSLYSDSSLLSCLKPPVSKSVFYHVLEKTRSVDMLERQRKIWYNSSGQSNNWETLENINWVAADLDPMKKTWNKEPVAQNIKISGNSVQKVTSSDVEVIAKLRKENSFLINGVMDERDSFSSDKMQFSGFFSPNVNTSNSFLFDGPSEGIPIYSYMDKRSRGVLSKASDTSTRLNSTGVASSCMPCVGSANKPTSLSNSVPPRLVSGSFNETTSIMAYDPYSHEIDPSLNITSKFQDVNVTDIVKTSSTSFGDDKYQSDITVLPSFSRTSTGITIPDTGWKPRGVLVAHLQEHSSSVNDIAVSNDNSFFVSASSDSTVKIWDSRKLEKDISFRSRLTYSLGYSQALCVSMLRGTPKVVVGASNGILHLFSIDYVSRGLGNVVERYSGIVDSRKKEVGGGAVLTLLNCSSSDSSICHTIIYSTREHGINLWDTRTDKAAWTFRVAPEEGFISSLVMGQCGNWFVSGSSRGILTLWDLRFLLPVNSWQYSTVCPVERMCLLIPSSNSTPAMARPLIYVSAGCNEVALWNAETGSCHQVFRVASCDSIAEMSNIPRALARPSSKPISKQDMKRNSSSKYRIDELNEPPPRLPGIRSLLPLPGGDLLTGGRDLKIRYWNHASPERSYSICGPSTPGLGNDEHYETRSSFGVQIVQEMNRRAASSTQTQKALLAAAATDSAGCHRDSVLSLASVKLNQRLLISSSRDGAIKVWK